MHEEKVLVFIAGGVIVAGIFYFWKDKGLTHEKYKHDGKMITVSKGGGRNRDKVVVVDVEDIKAKTTPEKQNEATKEGAGPTVVPSTDSKASGGSAYSGRRGFGAEYVAHAFNVIPNP